LRSSMTFIRRLVSMPQPRYELVRESRLDVVFHEDACRTRKDNSAENFSVIRRIALNILKKFPANMSLARKRRKCAYDDDFMAEVLLSAF